VCELFRYDYVLAREYNWNVKNKASRGYEENYFFVVKEDGVYYNELETRYMSVTFVVAHSCSVEASLAIAPYTLPLRALVRAPSFICYINNLLTYFLYKSLGRKSFRLLQILIKLLKGYI